MRDGTTLYADVFRPVTDARVPAIVNWAPYGKGQTGFWDLGNKKMFPNFFGVPRSRSEEHTSELPSLMRISYDVFGLTKKISNLSARSNSPYVTVVSGTDITLTRT